MIFFLEPQKILKGFNTLFKLKTTNNYAAAAAAAKSLQSCPTLGDPTDSSPPGSAVPGILQARGKPLVTTKFHSTNTDLFCQ